ncbi:hypothetical protein COMA2_30348 [Candidatus Nitrospira nitrificans]|uniref:Uncharacterized protein n=1 Tax=Candidatus Nitrospira nitrificans TaxID=1742973 RepID=A0A0S4LKZ2_9BACT|nr:hypothetical protein COMA2_30348 [Candidatus Nitrospira nitrificans]
MDRVYYGIRSPLVIRHGGPHVVVEAASASATETIKRLMIDRPLNGSAGVPLFDPIDESKKMTNIRAQY